MEYDFRKIEAEWQRKWKERGTYKVEIDPSRPKYYVLDMFPYPSGAGLHVGHPLGYIASDIYSRYKRLCGFNVLHPMGYDAFGLPAEQYAIQTGQHPAITTEQNIARYREQLDKIGFSFDWDREVRTCDPEYYKWTQWAFLKMYDHYYCNDSQKARPISELVDAFAKHGSEELNAACTAEQHFTAAEWNAMDEAEHERILQNYRLAFRADTMVNWCPQLGTVLANDEVKDGLSVRGGYPVEQKRMKQWLLRVTAYAQRMLDGLDTLDWSESLKEIQRNWIGRSEGAQMFFDVEMPDGSTRKLEIFTTRPDTVFGVTFMVIAPEHEWIGDLTTAEQKADVEAYIEQTKKRSERERIAETKRVSGVFTGSYAINPFSGKRIPIYASDYVLAGYGTGAIMAVPAHDSRDYAFARHFGLDIVPVVAGGDLSESSYDAKAGEMINSDFLDGKDVKDAIKLMFAEVEKRGIGKRLVNYRLRDAIFSRQRYWGEPFPIIHYEDGSIELVNDSELPVNLPEMEDFKPSGTGEPPLAKAKDWLNYTDPATGRKGRRETNTMPQWAGSCWYYLRYIDPKNPDQAWDPAKEKYWMPVDLYVGGAEHAVLHLLYSRFWHKVLFDLGLVSTKEPFRKLVNQGMILGVSYKDKRGALVPTDQVDFTPNGPVRKSDGEALVEFPAKMSKSLRNVVNPDDVIREYGADSMRMYEMFMGPLEATKPWSTKGVEGVFRFLKRAWRLVAQSEIVDAPCTPEQLRVLHATIRKVSQDLDTFNFNTAISQLMIFLNEFSKCDRVPREAAEKFVLLLSPFAPHIGEELWSTLGHAETLAYEPWPVWDEKVLEVNEVEILVQVLGKPKARLMMPVDADQEAASKLALAAPEVQAALGGKPVRKVIYVPKRLVNIVI